jgi:hypothetical protein
MKVKNAFDYNHIIASLKRSTGQWSYSFTVHGKGKAVGSIELTEAQFAQLKEQLKLREEPSLTSDTGKVYIIIP